MRHKTILQINNKLQNKQIMGFIMNNKIKNKMKNAKKKKIPHKIKYQNSRKRQNRYP